MQTRLKAWCTRIATELETAVQVGKQAFNANGQRRLSTRYVVIAGALAGAAQILIGW